MSSSTSTTQDPVAVVDRLYLQLRQQAEEMRDQFFQRALALQVDKKGHVPIGIAVLDPSENSFAAYWVRIFISAQGRSVRTINKGTGFKYPVGAFSFVKQPLKGLVRAYETELATLRQLASENRALRKSLQAHHGKVTRQVTQASFRSLAEVPESGTE